MCPEHPCPAVRPSPLLPSQATSQLSHILNGSYNSFTRHSVPNSGMPISFPPAGACLALSQNGSHWLQPGRRRGRGGLPVRAESPPLPPPSRSVKWRRSVPRPRPPGDCQVVRSRDRRSRLVARCCRDGAARSGAERVGWGARLCCGAGSCLAAAGARPPLGSAPLRSWRPPTCWTMPAGRAGSSTGSGLSAAAGWAAAAGVGAPPVLWC